MATVEDNIHFQSVRRNSVIHFDEGLIGFSECKDFHLMENDRIAPFRLLQSSQLKEVGFLVLEPSSVMQEYSNRIPAREWEAVGLMPDDPQLAFVICVIGRTPKDSTGNFQAPLIVNCRTMAGRQIILTDLGLSVRQSLV